MGKTNRYGDRHVRRGTAIVQTAVFGSLVGMGCLALAVDTGLEFNTRTELQAAADAAALAGAERLGPAAAAMADARARAAAVAALNKAAGTPCYIEPNVDVEFGHAVLNNGRYEYQPGVQPYDAMKVTVRRDGSDANHPKVPLYFAQALFQGGASISASAVAMLVPRDIALVFDLSGSMNDDSELRHYKDFVSEASGRTRPGVQVNTKDVWIALPIAKGNNGVGNGIDPAPPGNPTNYNDQPGTGPGSPNSQGGNPDPGAEPQGGSPNPAGPRWGWMTGWGTALTLGQYSPTSDSGLYYIPRNSTCTNADVIANLTEAGYSAAERSALLSGSFDGTWTCYANRVKVMLGLAGWKSKKSGSKYNGGPGNGDNKVDTNELTQSASYPFSGGSWDDWVTYVSSNSSEMYKTDNSFRYRYGIKTFVNYLLEKRSSNADTPDLKHTPEQPVTAAKDAVQSMIDLIVELDTQDHCSLEVFATSGRHEINLTVPSDSQSLATMLQTIPSLLYQRQSNHYDSTTNIGAGFQMAINELTSSRARSAAAKVVILLTDGKPNVGGSGLDPTNWALDRAGDAASKGMTLYTIGLGADVDPELLQEIADMGHGEYFFADSAPDPITGRPRYETELRDIFEQLGGKRPVRLIK